MLGRDLNAYAAAGIRSDHEAYTAEEGRERLRAGMWLLIREASAARNLQALLPLLAEYGPGRIAFCTDDREPEHIADDGHINAMVRDAVAVGIPPEDALVCATLNPALWHGLAHLGAVAPGYQADLLVLPDLERFVPDVVLKAGRPVAEIPRAEVPDWVRQTVRDRRARPGDVPHPVERRPRARDRPRAGPDRDRVARRGADAARRRGGRRPGARPGEDRGDRAAPRHRAGSASASCAASGSQRGALASTVAHDAHNIVVVGMSDAAMAFAVRRLANVGGGIVVVDGAEVLAELPLPVAGLLSDAPLDEVVARSRALVAAARELGCAVEAPFQLLAFLALSVIPSLKLTDRGLVDVDRFELVPLEARVILAQRAGS